MQTEIQVSGGRFYRAMYAVTQHERAVFYGGAGALWLASFVFSPWLMVAALVWALAFALGSMCGYVTALAHSAAVLSKALEEIPLEVHQARVQAQLAELVRRQ